MLDFTHFACKMENSIKSVRIQIRFVGSPELLLILSFSFFSLYLFMVGRITKMPRPTIN